jgi:hypothetical protein
MRTTLSVSLIVSTLGLALAVPAMGGGGGQGNQKDDSQISLVRPEAAPDGDAKGTLRIRSDNKGERFDVHIQKVDKVEHTIWIEDPDDSGIFVLVAPMGSTGGSQKYSVSTKKGDMLPLSLPMTEDLIGRRLEVRQGKEDVILQGTVPPYGLSKKPAKAQVDMDADEDDPAPDMHATLKLRSKANKGQERIDLKAKKVPFEDADLPFHVFVEDGVDSGVFVDSGELEKLSGSTGRWRRDTKKGQALPDGVGFVIELADRRIEVRDDDGTVYLAGTIPAVE